MMIGIAGVRRGLPMAMVIVVGAVMTERPNWVPPGNFVKLQVSECGYGKVL